MKRKNFTIVELLVVISIIAILAGLLLPAISGVRNKAKKTKAKAQCNAIAMAIKSYESTYGLLPWDAVINQDVCTEATVGVTDFTHTAATNNYDQLMMILTKTNNDNSTCGPTHTYCKDRGNARSIRFLDVPEGYTKPIFDATTTPPENSTGSFRDPWGNRYGIAMDLNYDNQVDIGGTVTQGTVFVWSYGPKGVNKYGDSTVGDKDDVASWHE